MIGALTVKSRYRDGGHAKLPRYPYGQVRIVLIRKAMVTYALKIRALTG